MAEDENIHIFKRAKLFKGLDDGEIERIFEIIRPSVREFDKNQIIVNQGEPVDKIGIVKTGTVISMKYHFNGDAQILRIYKPGEVLSLDTVNTSFLTSPSSLISQTDCTVIFLAYSKLFESDKLGQAVKDRILMNNCEILGNELIRLMYKIDVLSKRTLQERVLTYLSIISEKKGKNIFSIGMNQEEFAQYLCVNRSVLSKELNLMRSSGLIDYQKDKYTIFEIDIISGRAGRNRK